MLYWYFLTIIGTVIDFIIYWTGYSSLQKVLISEKLAIVKPVLPWASNYALLLVYTPVAARGYSP